MDLNKFFQSCKIGDLQKEKELDINIKDSFDSTPLYYACLCGHYDIVKYLLLNGAKCEIDTFQGERCLYGALSNKIRNLLKNFKVITSHRMKRVPFQEYMRKIWENHQYCDAILKLPTSYFDFQLINNKTAIELKENQTKDDSLHILLNNEKLVPINMAIIAARSRYFHNLFLKPQKCSKYKDLNCLEFELSVMFEPAYVLKVVQYLYTGLLEFDVQHLDTYLELSKKLHFSHLEKELLSKKSVYSQANKPYIGAIKSKRCGKKRNNKCSAFVITIEGETEVEKLKSDMGLLSPSKLSKTGFFAYCDFQFRIENDLFPCHKVFFINRSDYFRALILDHFSESSGLSTTDCPAKNLLQSKNDINLQDIYTHLPIIELKDTASPVFKHVIRYIYEDRIDIEPDLLFDVMQAADKFLLQGLKKLCSYSIANNLDNENVVLVLQASRLYSLPNLEDACARYIADNLQEILTQDGFLDIVKHDAAQVLNRQETDTISIVDDVRFYITNHVQTFQAMQSADTKLQLLDQLLESLGLEA